MLLWKNPPHKGDKSDFEPYLTPFLVEGAQKAVVICPGGGYEKRTDYEGIGYAQWMNAHGISAFVLDYRISPDMAPAPMADIQRAVRIARFEAAKLGISKVGVMGSSAGGHLAATISVHYDYPFYSPEDDIDSLSARPDFSILCYPVIDMGEYRHDPSRIALLGQRVRREDVEFYSPHLHVTQQTPPAFVWHCCSDQLVPAQNSMLYAMALAEQNIPFDLHIYKKGLHGWGLQGSTPYVRQWSEALLKWLSEE